MYSKKRKSSSTKILLILSLLAAFMGFALPAAASPTCGDSVLESGEKCDTGSLTSDICTGNCQTLKEGWVCNLQAKCNNQEEDEGEVCDPKSSSPDKEWCEECSRIIDLSAPTIEMYKKVTGLPLDPIKLAKQSNAKKIQLETERENNPNNSGFIILNEDTFFPGDSTRTLEFKLSNETKVKTDDDFIGIAFGIRPGDVGNAGGTGKARGFDTTDSEGPADFVLLQWKDEQQPSYNFQKCSQNGLDNNYKGISLAHIRGEVTWGELWSRPKTPCAENTNGSFTLLSDPRDNPPAAINYVTRKSSGDIFPTLRVVYSKTRIQVFVDQLSDGNYRKVIDKEGIFPTHGKIGLFVMVQNAMSFKFLHATENNIAVCRPERCGDGYVATTTTSGILSDIAEECDPGAEKYKNGGCDTLCRLEEGWDCSGASCEEKKGDGLVVGKEECDEGTDTTEGCNNGKITEGWSCPKYGGKCFKITLESLKPSDGETVYYTNTPSISFSGTRAGADLSKIHVSVQKGGSEKKLCTTTAPPSGDNWTAAAGCDLDATNGGVGTYTVTVIGIDAEGNRQVIKQQVVYDKTKPTSSVSKLTKKGEADEKLTDKSGKKVAVDNPDIVFTAAEDTKSLSVTITKKGSSKIQNVTVTKGNDGTWKLPTSDLENDEYTVSVTATDKAGNVQETPSTFTFTVDTTKPTSSVAKLTEKDSLNKELASETGKKVKVNNPDIVFTAAEDTKSLTVTITKKDGNPVPPITATKTDGTWKAPTSDLADGEYTVSVTATDEAGNVQETPSTFTFTVDTTKPTSSVAKLTKKDQIDEKLTDKSGEKVAVSNPDIVFTAAEDTKSLTVTITKKGGTPTTLTVTKGNDGTWKLPTHNLNLADDQYTVSVTATDEAGNVQETPSTFTFTVDTTKPEVAITSPTTGAQSNNDKTTITGTATELGSVTVVVTKPDNSSACRSEITIEKDEDKSWSLKECDTSEEGEYTVTVTATDEAGNQSETKTSKFVINKQAPTLEIEQSAPSYNKETKPSKITGTVKEGVKLNVVVTKEGSQDPVCELNTDPTQSTWEVDEQQSCTFDDGEYTVTAVATDKANNTATKTYKFTVDTTPPTVTLVGPKEGSETKTNKQKVVVRASEDAASVQATLTPQGGGAAKTVEMTKNDDGTTWSADFGDLTDGKTYDVVVVATDKAGNTSEKAHTSFTVSTPPKAEIEMTTDKTGKVPYKDHKATLNVSGTPNKVVVTVTPKVEGKQPFTVEATPNDGQWEISLTEDHELQPGVTYEFSVTATDSSEKSSTTTKTVTVASSVDEKKTSETRTQEGKRVITGEAKPGSTLTIRKNGDSSKKQTVTVDESGKWTLTLEGDLEDAQELEYIENGASEWSRLPLNRQSSDLGGYVLGGCSTTPTTPKEGLIPLLLSAFGLFFLRRRKK